MNWIVPNLWLIPALPLLAAAVTALAKRPQRALAATLAIGSMVIAFVLACAAFVAVRQTRRDNDRLNNQLRTFSLVMPGFNSAGCWTRSRR